MSSSSRTGWFARRGSARPAGLRVLTADARRLNLEDRGEAKRIRGLRQGWQSDAWSYRDAIGELRYAVNFLANCAARMKLFPAAYPPGAESDSPVPLDELEDVPSEVAEAARQAMVDLGNGRLAVSGLLHSLSTNMSVAGECFLLGQQDVQTAGDSWTVRSVDELVVRDDKWQIREIPSDPQGVIPWIDLDPQLTVVSRIWTPHPRFRLMADSQLRALLDDCESLLILRRQIRAVGRSRLSNGILFVPDGLDIKRPVEDNEDPESDPFMGELARAMMEPIANEGVAESVVPIVVRGDGEVIGQVKHLLLGGQLDEATQKVRDELVGVIGTGLDLPKEVVTGIVDLNHWSAWQVDDNTFRHHVEPHVISCCDGLTGAYLRPYLVAAGVPDPWVQRMLFWYDPTELVTHPDQSKDALDLHDRFALSNEALRRITGFSETDAPSIDELQVRLLHSMRQWPPNLVMEFFHKLDPSLVVPPINTAGTVPGIKPSGVDVGEPAGQLPAAPAVQNGGGPAPAEEHPGTPAQPGPPASPVTAAAGRAPDTSRLSRKLATIDRDLRARLQTAANAAMLRSLERAGARLRSRVAKDETLRSRIAHRANERVPAILGESVVATIGVTPGELVGGDWNGLRGQFYEWTETAQKQALAAAIRIGSLAEEADAVKAAEAAMAAGRDAGWDVLSGALTNLAHHLLYNPDPNVGPGDWAGLNPDHLVPTGTIRAALGVAGGTKVSDMGTDPGGVGTVDLGAPVGQIGTGSTITDLLTEAGATTESYTWEHGPSLNPFDGHLDLDGVEFESFDDDQLANAAGWPDNAYFFPGDHQGCLCDFAPNWLGPTDAGGGEEE